VLGAAALILLVARPETGGEIGFQYSFLAVLGIVLGSPVIERVLHRLGLYRPAARYFAVSLAAPLAVLPIMAHHFGVIPIAGFLANPLLVWSFTIILPLGLLLPVISIVWFGGAVFLASGLSVILDLFLAIAERCADLPGALLHTGYPPGPIVALMYAGLLGVIQWAEAQSWASRVVSDRGPAGQKPRTDKGLPGDFAPPSGQGAPQRPGPPPGMTTPARKNAPAGASPSPCLPPPLPEEPVLHPLRERDLVEAIDQQMAVFPKRALKGAGHQEVFLFPVRELSAEAQTLFHRLDDLDRDILTREPDRLLQAQVYALALIGAECLTRLPAFMHPPPTPGELPMPVVKVRNRHLAQAMAADTLIHSPLPGRINHPVLQRSLAALPAIYDANTRLLGDLIRRRDPSQVDRHLALRQNVLEWLRGLVTEPSRPSSASPRTPA
jgi:hypothetical protein